MGPNGSGKTTTFNLISGYINPDWGQITFNGVDITGFKPHQVCRLGISRTFQLTKPFLGMTVLQNVMVGKAYGSNSRESMQQMAGECQEILSMAGLSGKGALPANTLGVVERKRLEVARALASGPKLLLLDEMMSGLTAAEMEDALKLVERISDSGITLIVVEHVVKAILQIANKLLVLDYGEKIAEGEPGTVVNNERVIEAYLGT